MLKKKRKATILETQVIHKSAAMVTEFPRWSDSICIPETSHYIKMFAFSSNGHNIR